MKVVIEIELGNDAMRTDNHVANALRIVLSKILAHRPIYNQELGHFCKVMDLNGNSVGEVRLEP